MRGLSEDSRDANRNTLNKINAHLLAYLSIFPVQFEEELV